MKKRLFLALFWLLLYPSVSLAQLDRFDVFNSECTHHPVTGDKVEYNLALYGVGNGPGWIALAEARTYQWQPHLVGFNPPIIQWKWTSIGTWGIPNPQQTQDVWEFLTFENHVEDYEYKIKVEVVAWDINGNPINMGTPEEFSIYHPPIDP